MPQVAPQIGRRGRRLASSDELFSQVNYLTKTRFKDECGAAKFLLVGFDNLPEEDQKRPLGPSGNWALIEPA